MAYTGSNPHYQASGYTQFRNVKIIRETDKSWQVQVSDGHSPYIPKSQMRHPTPPLQVGTTRAIEVKTWLVEKWERATQKENLNLPTFEFDPQEVIAHELMTTDPSKSKEPDDSFLYDYTKKQLVAACAAYRSVLQQLQCELTQYVPQLSTVLARDRKVLDGRAGSPDGFGNFPTIQQKWANPEPIKESSKQIAAVLKSIYIGQATLEKMAQIESILGEKRADVAAELLRSLDEDEE